MEIKHLRRAPGPTTSALAMIVTAMVLTGCMTSDDRNAQHLDAVTAVAEQIHGVIGTTPPSAGAAVNTPCFGASGEEIDRQAAGAGDLIETGVAPNMLDQIIAEFDSPDGLRDGPSTLADQTSTREIGFSVDVDGVAVQVVAWSADNGSFSWSAQSSCNN